MKLISTLGLILLAHFCFSQRQEVSFIAGYSVARVDVGATYGSFLIPFKDHAHHEGIVIGGNYHYNLGKKEFLRLNAGLHYHGNHLLIPIGFNVDFGKKFHVLAGLGLNVKLEISNNIPIYNRWQMGWYYSLGLGYRISDRLDVTFNYRMNNDITALYDGKQTLLGGGSNIAPYYESFGSLQLSVSYTLFDK